MIIILVQLIELNLVRHSLNWNMILVIPITSTTTEYWLYSLTIFDNTDDTDDTDYTEVLIIPTILTTLDNTDDIHIGEAANNTDNTNNADKTDDEVIIP